MPPYCYANTFDSLFELKLISGIRTDNLNWSIAGNETTPVNILSELKFNRLDISQFGVAMRFSVNRFFFMPQILKGEIHEGEATDSDYAGNNRTNLTYRSIMDVKDNGTTDVTLTVGYEFKLSKKHLSLSPLLGYSQKKQNFVMTNGKLLYPENKAISDLDSKYSTDWESAFGGVSCNYFLPFQINISALFLYHDLDYEAEANWNLRDDFAHPVSFRHSGDGYGSELQCGIGYSIRNWCLEFSYNYKQFEIEDGKDELYFSSGLMIESRLNEVEWESESISLEVVYTFE